MKLWIGVYTHRHGTDVAPYWLPDGEALTEERIIEAIEADGAEFEPEREESIEALGPFDLPEQRIAIVCDGGLVQNVTGNAAAGNVDVVTIDYDIDGIPEEDEHENVEVPQDDGDVEEARVWREGVDVAKNADEWFRKLEEAIDERDVRIDMVEAFRETAESSYSKEPGGKDHVWDDLEAFKCALLARFVGRGRLASEFIWDDEELVERIVDHAPPKPLRFKKPVRA